MRGRTVPSGAAVAYMALAVAASIVAGIFPIPPSSASPYGMFLPSAESWPLIPFWSWLLNATLLFSCVAVVGILNRHYSLVKGTDNLLTTLLALTLACNLFAAHSLTTGTLMLVVWLICLAILFDCYKAKTSTKDIFVASTLISVGIMFSYSFIVLAVALLLGAIMVNCLGVKEFFALGLGLIAPYWVALGLGLLSPTDFHLPEITTIFEGVEETPSLFIMTIGGGVALLTAMLLSLNNTVKLYAGNSKIRHLNDVVNTTGILAAIAMVVDYSDITCYIGIFNLWVSIQLSNLFALWHIRRSRLLFAAIVAIIVTFFIFEII